MSHVSHYIPGSHLFRCDRCGCNYHADKKRREWTGFIVCFGPGTNNCWEPRHPQDYVRARAEDPSVKDARIDPDDSLTLPYWEGMYALYGSDNKAYVDP